MQRISTDYNPRASGALVIPHRDTLFDITHNHNINVLDFTPQQCKEFIRLIVELYLDEKRGPAENFMQELVHKSYIHNHDWQAWHRKVTDMLLIGLVSICIIWSFGVKSLMHQLDHYEISHGREPLCRLINCVWPPPLLQHTRRSTASRDTLWSFSLPVFALGYHFTLHRQAMPAMNTWRALSQHLQITILIALIGHTPLIGLYALFHIDFVLFY